MTVSSSTSKVQYNGNGSTAVFAYTFKIFDQDDIEVIIRSANGTETLQTIGTHYTVSGVGDAGGGNVTMLTAPASTETITIIRQQPLTQELDLVPNDPFPANSMEDALDRLTFMVQAHSEELDRAIKASKTNTIGSTEFTISADDRANKVFAFDNTGELAVTQELGIYRGNWSAATSYAVRDLIKDTSNNNVYICQTAHTSSGAQPISSNPDSAKWALIVDAASATTSALSAASSATAAASSAADALVSENNAAASETAAAASETAAAASETAAAGSATAAASSASAAATSATNSATSATASAGSASAAATSATSAANSATAAASSASAAATSETNAATSETNAAGSATAAAGSATAAASSANAAATSASAAATSATNAATSETNAATSATAAAASQVAAAASAASAANSYDLFDDRYLGSKTSDPTLDNDGNALVAGALYFNSTANEMRVYDGGNWIPASSAGGVSLVNYNFTATAGQTVFSGADDNAVTLSYTQSNLIVTLNGIVLEDGSDYTATDGTSITLAVGAALDDELNVAAFKSFTVADTYSRSEADAAFATAAQGALADTAVQPNDNVTLGAVTATSFVGDGSSLTGLSAGPTEVVSSGTASNVTSIDFTSLDFDTYNYRFVLHNFKAASAYQYLQLAVSNNNLSTFINIRSSAMDVTFGSTSVGAVSYGLASPITVSSVSISTVYPSTFAFDLSYGSDGTRSYLRGLTSGLINDNSGNERFTYGALTSDTLYSVATPNSFRVGISSTNISSDWTLYRTAKA